MPSKGFKVVSVREDAYAAAEKIAEEDNRSIGDITSQALLDYSATRHEVLSKAKQLLRFLDTQSASQTGSP